MRKITTFSMLLMMAVACLAMPARRGWQVRTQADGSTIEIQVVGDEYYHYTVNRAGQEVREVNGMYEVAGEAPTASEVETRRAKGIARRQRKEIGVTPNLAPKGVVILVNFSDKSMQSSHTQAVYDELFNSANCTVNSYNGVNYPSAGQYFADQSNGSYHPQFDVFGPVTLSRSLSYYGRDGSQEGDDQHATDAVVEGCILANEQFNINWADYDSDNDGYVDFVYVIYAGMGQADGGASNTIWPHNWTVSEAMSYGYCSYTNTQRTLGGKKIENYAMSGELGSGNTFGAIGTLCHEFGHVMGLPDFYDTEYGTNYNNCLTPGDWDIMDGGGYNADGHCPPSYSPWEKEFFGWHTTINLGTEGQNLTLYANGTEGYQAYQITTSGSYVSSTTAGLRYYIENRQPQGWDAPLSGHGMLLWKVNFNSSKWTSNTPNNTANNPYYTVVSATGTKIGWDGSTDNCPKNPFPGSGNKTSYTGITGKPLLNIAERNGVVTLTYIEEPPVIIEPFDIQWKANGADFAVTTSTGTVVLPEETPEACADGKVFAGWCSSADYEHASAAPAFVHAGDAVEEGAVFYAVFATQEGEGGAPVSDVLTNETTGISGNSYASWSGKTVSSSAVYAGQSAGGYSSIQIRSSNSNSGIITTASGGKVSKVAVEWNTNTTAGRTLDVYGKNEAYSDPSDLYDNATKGTKIGSIECGADTELTIEGDYTFIGLRSKVGAMYLNSVTIIWGGSVSYSNYSTRCGGGESIVEMVAIEPAARKAIRDGQLVIVRGDEVYSVTGVRLQ